MVGFRRQREIKLLIGKVQSLTPLIGDEIVFVLSRAPLATTQVPALLAEVQPGQEAALQQSLAQLFGGAAAPYQVSGGLLVISDSPTHLGMVVARLARAPPLPSPPRSPRTTGRRAVAFLSDAATMAPHQRGEAPQPPWAPTS